MLAVVDILVARLQIDGMTPLVLLSLPGVFWQPSLLALLVASVRRLRLTCWAAALVSSVVMLRLKLEAFNLYLPRDLLPLLVGLSLSLTSFLSLWIAAVSLRYRRRGDIALASTDTTSAPPRRWQVELLDLLGLMTVVAIAVPLASFVEVKTLIPYDLDQLAAAGPTKWCFTAGVTLGAIAVSVPWLWLLLNSGDQPSEFILLAAIVGAVCLVLLGALGLAVFAIATVNVVMHTVVIGLLWKYNVDDTPLPQA